MKKTLTSLSLFILGSTMVFGLQICSANATTTSQKPQTTQSTGTAAKQKKQALAAIKISNFSFSPSSLSVKVGTKVTWTNQDAVPHLIISKNKSFTSASFNKGDSFSFTFKSKEAFPYSCKIHPSMKGKITVK